MLNKISLSGLFLALFIISSPAFAQDQTYTIVDTGQKACFDNTNLMDCPDTGQSFFGQDAQYKGNQPAYRDNADGTITDLVTGLMWVKARGSKVTWNSALADAKDCTIGGFSDWRAPTIKELYSLIDFNGWLLNAKGAKPFINTKFFDYKYGNTNAGERDIDCQDWSATKYVSKTMNGNPTVFGVNFADGRIKGYAITKPRNRQKNKLYIRYVRGNTNYGQNKFVDNGDKTVTDQATTLIWHKDDSGRTLNWEDSLSYCENLTLAGRSDWRLPNAKELQSIVDYSRSPATTNSAAIDPIFNVSDKESYYWTSTTHLDGPRPKNAVYITFGRAKGYMKSPRSSQGQWMDVHGAGAQRSDPKSGDPSKFPNGHGPQGDDIRIYNYVRCVSGGKAIPDSPPTPTNFKASKSQRGSNSMQRQGGMNGKGNSQMNGQRRGQNQGQGGGQGGGMRQGPPPEALNACSGKSQGDNCSFTTPRGTMNGNCLQIGQDNQMGCVPERTR